MAFPQFEAVDNILVTSLDNTNPILHPATTIFSTALIESEKEWRFYIDGFTPSVGKYVEQMDQERINIGKALRVELISCLKQLEVEYDVYEDNLSDAIKANPVYQDIKGQHTLNTRYLTEDIPMGLVPFVELGKILGLPVDRMEAVINMGELLLEKNLTEDARTLEKIGINQLSVDEFQHFLQTGKRN